MPSFVFQRAYKKDTKVCKYYTHDTREIDDKKENNGGCDMKMRYVI